MRQRSRETRMVGSKKRPKVWKVLSESENLNKKEDGPGIKEIRRHLLPYPEKVYRGWSLPKGLVEQILTIEVG